MLTRAVISVMVGILLVIKPDALKKPFGEKTFINPEAAPTKSYIRLMRGLGIVAIIVGVLVILKEINIVNVFKVPH
jgi:hypothetical protein